MNPRERFLETLLFGKPDRTVLAPGMGRESTLETWREQGLPSGISAYNEYAYRQAGGELPWPTPDSEPWLSRPQGACGISAAVACPSFPVQERMIPAFEEKILEQREDSKIVQDWKGNVCEISDEFTVQHLRDPIDFCTRRWINCPVESREDWEEMKERYDPDHPDRLPDNLEGIGAELKDRSWPLEVTFPGPFWQMREWMGFEALCRYLYDDPELVSDMMDFWREFLSRLMEKLFRHVVPDVIHISEDMAYKGKSMLSPSMVRNLLMPAWKEWGDLARDAGVRVYAIDSDGYTGELIPLWIEAGMNACDPVEVAAGNDIDEYRQQFGRDMAFGGGVDKRAIASGGDALDAEIERLRSVIEDGGYIPSCDHGVPSDVSWPNYVRYIELLATATGWL